VSQRFLLDAVSTSQRSKEIRETREHWTRKHPRGHFAATAGDQGPFKEVRLRLPTGLRKHATDTCPPEAWLDEKASAHVTCLR
jgi:hypothetical protein